MLIELDPEEGDREALGCSLDDLSDYIFKHFREEEAIMAQVGFPGLVEHREMHKEFARKSMGFNKRYRSGEDGLAVEMLLFLSNWLIEHIKGEDPRYLEAFKEAGY